MKDNTSRHLFASARRYPYAVARMLMLVAIGFCNQVVLCSNNPNLTDERPFTFEFPATHEQTITLVTDTTSFLHCCPILGKVISPFGRRGGRTHTGVDVKLKHGDAVGAALKGVVKMAKSYSGYGKLVILTHPDGYETYYAHLSKCLVAKGDTVVAGQIVGLGGRTGRATTDHLHFEVRKNGAAQDPEQYFGFANGDLKKHILFGVKELFIASVKKNEPHEVKTTSKEPVIEVPTTDSYVTIRPGDTLYSLAKQYGTSVSQLQDLNQLEGSLLKIGMRLRIN